MLGEKMMKLFAKIKEYGISESVKIGYHKLIRKINDLLIYIFRILPIDPTLIVMESEGDLSDNAYALYDYLKSNGYLNKYSVVWLVYDVDKAARRMPETSFISKEPIKIDIRRSKYLATCRWFMYDHRNIINHLKKRKDQSIVYLSHGAGFKDSKGDTSKIKTWFDIIFMQGDIPAQIAAHFWNQPIEKVKRLGYSRTDYFFQNHDRIRQIFSNRFHTDNNCKIIIWMPTFRKSTSKELSEEYKYTETGLPIFDTVGEIRAFDHFLEELGIYLVIKPHPLQAKLPVFSESFRRILILLNEDLSNLGIQLYQFVGLTDALITDYSSIAHDYLLLNKPIIYTLDDYDDYSKSRGLWPENALEYMVGYHVYNKKDFENALKDISRGQDIYNEARNLTVPLFHDHVDGNSSQRIVNYLKL